MAELKPKYRLIGYTDHGEYEPLEDTIALFTDRQKAEVYRDWYKINGWMAPTYDYYDIKVYYPEPEHRIDPKPGEE